MKKFLPIACSSILFLHLTSCSDSSDQHALIAPETAVKDYANCVESTAKPLKCKPLISRAICGFYKINDFKKPEGDEYYDYDKILELVQQNGMWKRTGDASSQEALDAAKAWVENGGAALIINEENSVVAMVAPGEMSKSTSWGLNCPNTIFIYPNQPEKSFVYKSLNYAFAGAEGLGVWLREG